MRGVSGAAEPGVQDYDSNQPATLFAALYGDLAVHPWRDPTSDRDPYVLFHDRSLAMGWLDDSTVVTATSDDGQVRERRTGIPGLWSMNDAGGHHECADPKVPLASWFQVDVGAVPGGRPLPVQPFLRCAADATASIGRLELHAAQILLPVHILDITARPEPARMPSLQSAAWFDDRDPTARTPVEVILDSAQPLGPRQLQKRIGQLDQCCSRCNRCRRADRASRHKPTHRTLRGQVMEGMDPTPSASGSGWPSSCVKVFEQKISGSLALDARPALSAAIDYLRPGDMPLASTPNAASSSTWRSPWPRIAAATSSARPATGSPLPAPAPPKCRSAPFTKSSPIIATAATDRRRSGISAPSSAKATATP